MRRRWIEGAIGAFATGILLSSFVSISQTEVVGILILVALLSLIAIFQEGRRKRGIVLVAFFTACALAGVIRFSLLEGPDTHLAIFRGSIVTLEGVISAEPDVRETLVFLEVSAKNIFYGGEISPIDSRIRVGVDRYPEFEYGDRIVFTGKLVEPENFLTDSGTVFDYRSYLAKSGIYYEMFRPQIEVRAKGEGNIFVGQLLTFKSAFLGVMSRLIPEPENGLMAGILLGIKHGIPSELSEVFRRSGLVHIIVLSGYNLTIVAYAITRSFRFFPKFFPVFLPPLAGALGIIAFTIMAGASATAVRAALMALLVIFAQSVGRRYDITRGLALAGFAMLLHNPKILAFDPSFQLSFLATMGLVYLSPWFIKRLGWITKRLGLRNIVAATFATQIFVLPRLVGLSGDVSLVGVLANILVLPFVPSVMFLGAVTGFLGFVHMYLAAPFAYGAYLLLHAFIAVADFFASLPFATAHLPRTISWVLAGIYVLWAFVVLRKRVTI